MNLTVQIKRVYNEPNRESWHFEAYVIQEGRKGEKNIIGGRRFTKLDSARMEIQKRLIHHTISFIDPPAEEPITTAQPL